MKLTVAVLILFLSCFTTAELKSRTADPKDFIQASKVCLKRLKIPQSYKSKFSNFDYPDEPIVHGYVHCIWVDMDLWDDRIGFDVEHIAEVYKDTANTEVLIPILSDCNRNKHNDRPQKWAYKAFKCILDSRVGTCFKEKVAKQNNKLQK